MDEESKKNLDETPEVVNPEVVEPTKEEKVKKPKSKVRKIIGWVLTGIFFAFFAVFAAGQIDGMIHKNENYGQTISFGFGSFVILTDSMEPDYMTNSAIITHRDSLESVYDRYQKSLTDSTIKIDMTFMDVYQTYVKPLNHPELNDQTNPTGVVMTHRLREIQVDESKTVGDGRYTFIVAGINTSEHQAQAGQYQAFTEKQYLGIVQANSKVLGGFYRFISSPWGLLVFLLVPAFYLVITSVLDIFSAMKDNDEEDEGGGGDGGNTPSSLDELSDKDRERLKKELLEEMLNKKGEK
ncbi:MAG: hypothetical protein E7178_03140 [Erysipelotrichaceae bacterium]|nr:hypothetical protein [Erysipelotrichaceae bacterium]